MRFSALFVSLAVLLAAPLAFSLPPPSLKTVERYQGDTSGKYIVKLKSGVSRKQWIKRLKLEGTAVDWDLLNGFASHLDDAALSILRASDDVEVIAEDGVVYATTSITQTNATWGLQRISQRAKLTTTDPTLLTYNYTYDSSAGTGVDIYIVDTGIYIAHNQFGGRATWGGTFGVNGTADGLGHGTHCAGTAAGSQYGVAKNASLIAVKVLGDDGSGTVSGIITGLNWVAAQVAITGKPSIVSMSLGGGGSTVFDNGVASLTQKGIHVVVAAGNDNTNAANTSPARAPTAVTVGASTINDARASFSNYGAVVDLFAPGQDVISAWIGSPDATNIISGTSMATPHITGLLAYLIGKDGNLTPAALQTKVKALSVGGVLSGIPTGTVNSLAQNS